MIFKEYLFTEKLPILNKALDAYALRQKVIAKNIANATSVAYQPEEVKFEELFNKSKIALTGSITDNRHIPLGKKSDEEIYPEDKKSFIPEPEIYFSGDSHVNIDKEMAELAKNQIRFRYASKAAKSYFNDLQIAIRGLIR